MNSSIKNCNRWFTFHLLLATALWIIGCTAPKPASNPLAGWNYCFSQNPDKIDKAIRNEYQDYIQKLPSEVRYYVPGGGINFFEDGTGQHAVKIEIPLHGVYSEHVLFYDKENKRVKVIIYSGGRYAS